jgi:hypothetical protein
MTTTGEFIRWFAALAPEGETALLVRQKPLTPLQYHADGAVKATWPAVMPGPGARAIREGQSWYGNTASFILDRMRERVSAAAANCEFVLVMVLDDVGTKSKEPPLPPTWVMETSLGNFQWGYAFSEQPPKQHFAAAIAAIADAGYTDPGACNPVRNFRVPGSVNLKQGKGEFAARLVEFSPEREYTLDEICAALGVTYDPEAGGSGPAPVYVLDDGGDDVAAWLVGQGLVYSRPNSTGWMGVQCPNAAEHTDGSPEGRYHPASRSYCCLHSHCLHLDSRAFLRWVGVNGGPQREPGLREELVATRLASTLSQLPEPPAELTEAAAAVVAEVELRELGRIEKGQWFEQYAYVLADDSYYHLETRRELDRRGFNALYRHIGCRSIHDGRRVEASVCFDENRSAAGGRVISGMTYAAGESALVANSDGEVFGNRWRDARAMVDREAEVDISRWLELCERLVPERSELEHLWDVMAFKLQHPEVKVNHAVLHAGTQGCGKDSMWAPFQWAVCGGRDADALRNHAKMDAAELESQWGYALESEIIVLNELHESAASERRALANRLKPIIAAPPMTLTVNRKHKHPYEVMNRAFVLAFSNYPVPISIDSQDRRWFCIWSHAPRMADGEGKALWQWFRRGGFAAVASWLWRRDVSAFDAGATPAWTDYKYSLIEHSMSQTESFLVGMIRGRHGEFAKGAVCGPYGALCERVQAMAPPGAKVYQAALLHAFSEAGWIDMGRLASSEYSTKKHVFAAPDVVRMMSKSDIRRLVEDVPPGALKVVK